MEECRVLILESGQEEWVDGFITDILPPLPQEHCNRFVVKTQYGVFNSCHPNHVIEKQKIKMVRNHCYGSHTFVVIEYNGVHFALDWYLFSDGTESFKTSLFDKDFEKKIIEIFCCLW